MAAGKLDPEKEEWLLQQLEQATEFELEEIYPMAEWQAATLREISEKELADVYNIVTKQTQEQEAVVVPVKPEWWKKDWIKAAAVVTLIISTGTLFVTDRINHIKHQGGQVAAKWNTYSTRDGELKVVLLPDSTKLYINGATEISIPEVFAHNKREIKLIRGEAFIEVSQDAARPFNVEMGAININVLGTSFNMRNYINEPSASVAVKTGKVAMTIQQTNQRLVLTEGNSGHFERKTLSLQMSNSNRRAGDWRKQEFYFDGVPLRDVFEDLKHLYGLQFKTNDEELLNRSVKATFRKQTPDEIIKILSIMGGFKYEKVDSVIHIYSLRK